MPGIGSCMKCSGAAFALKIGAIVTAKAKMSKFTAQEPVERNGSIVPLRMAAVAQNPVRMANLGGIEFEISRVL